MVLLYRPQFVFLTLTLLSLLSTLITFASGAPQFGRPLLHVYEETDPMVTLPEYTSSTQVSTITLVASTTSTAISTLSSAGAGASSTSDIPLASGTAAQTNAALSSQAGCITPLAMGSAAAATILYLVL